MHVKDGVHKTSKYDPETGTLPILSGTETRWGFCYLDSYSSTSISCNMSRLANLTSLRTAVRSSRSLLVRGYAASASLQVSPDVPRQAQCQLTISPIYPTNPSPTPTTILPKAPNLPFRHTPTTSSTRMLDHQS